MNGGYGITTDQLAGRERITGVAYDIVIDAEAAYVIATDGDPLVDTPEWSLPILTDDPAERIAAIVAAAEALRTYEEAE